MSYGPKSQRVIPASEELKAKMKRLSQSPPATFHQAKAQVEATYHVPTDRFPPIPLPKP